MDDGCTNRTRSLVSSYVVLLVASKKQKEEEAPFGCKKRHLPTRQGNGMRYVIIVWVKVVLIVDVFLLAKTCREGSVCLNTLEKSKKQALP